jgi:hypothetical protein
MPTNLKTKTKRAAQRKSHAPESAIALLKQDHREVEGYFEEYDDLEDNKAKAELARKICNALKVQHKSKKKSSIRQRAKPRVMKIFSTRRSSNMREQKISSAKSKR